MTDPIYKIGTRRDIGRSWILTNGDPVDPDFIAITVREPDGVQTKFLKPQMTNPVAGRWTIAWTFRKPGRHVFTIETAGNVAQTDEYFVQVSRPQGYSIGQSVIATSNAVTLGKVPQVATT